MFILKRSFSIFVAVCVVLSSLSMTHAQEKKTEPNATPILWEESDIGKKDLYYGPGGKEMLPDLNRVTFIKEEKQGFNKKYRIKDGAGRVWIAKITREPQAEAAAVRLLWGIGYKTEINYLVPEITIPGKGTFRNVRLKARPEPIQRLYEWKWKENPFLGRREFQGLKIMMVFLANWDIADRQNKILQVNGQRGNELHYVISDLGATFGRLGNNNLPLIYRLGRQIGRPDTYLKAKLVDEVEGNHVRMAYKGNMGWLFQDITVEDVKWVAGLLNELSDDQIKDIFRAANYSRDDIETFTRAVKNRIDELNRVIGGNRSGEKRGLVSKK
jgi:hypothetical protein